MRTHVASFVIPGRVTPKIRWGKSRGYKTANETDNQRKARLAIERYNASRDRVRAAAFGALRGPYPLAGRFSLGVAVWLGPVADKGSANYGGLPANGGDWEGIYGTVADALHKPAKGLPAILRGDDVTVIAGAGPVLVDGVEVEPLAYLAPSGVERVCVSLWRLA